MIGLARSKIQNIYRYKKESQKKQYNPWKYVNKTENQAHLNNFKTIHDSLIKISIKQQQQTDVTLGLRTTDYSTLYDTKKIPLDDGREIQLRYVKIPTVSNHNKPQYYVMFFVNIDHYSIHDLKSLHAMCLNSIDQKSIEGYLSHGNQGRYTIYLSGKQTGRMQQIYWNQSCRAYHIFKINTITAKGKTRSYAEVRKNIFTTLEKLFTSKLNRLVESINEGWHWYKDQKVTHKLYGHIKEDVARLQEFLVQIQKTAQYFWKVMMQLKKQKMLEIQARRNADLNSTETKYSNNIRKQTDQYLKLLSEVEKSCEKSQKRGERRVSVASWV